MIAFVDHLCWRCSSLLLLLLTACQSTASESRLPLLPQDPQIQVYFNQSQASEYAEFYRQQSRPGDNLEQIIIDAIASAQTSIDVAVQEFRTPEIALALAAKHNAGIKIRVILENNYSRSWSQLTPTDITQLDPQNRSRYDEYYALVDLNQDQQLSQGEINQRDALIILQNQQIPWIDDTADNSKGSGLMHHKFIVVDGQMVIITSANFTSSDLHGDFQTPASRGNPNNLLKIASFELAQAFTQEFNLMWGDGQGGKPDSLFGVQKPFRPLQQFRLGESLVSLQFSPTSQRQTWSETTNGSIAKALTTAQKSVDLALFVFSEQNLSNTLQTLQPKNVQIRTLIESDFAYRNYSEGLDMLGVALSQNCQFSAENRPWQVPLETVGVPILPPGDRLHHKFALIDDTIVITGSHNWSAAANQNNDEALIIVQNPTIAAHFRREFDRLYQNAELGITSRLQQQLDQDQKQCPQGFTVAQDSGYSQLINLNTATQAELETLPGIGAQLAQRIITTRQTKAFTTLQDLDQVPGVGQSLLEKLEGRVTF